MRHSINRKIVFSFLLIFAGMNSSVVQGANYYMRADGAATNKKAATSCSAPSTAMSIDTHNKEKFLPDDVIQLCDDGGEYKASIIAPSGGSDGHPVIYKNADGDTPVIDLSVDVGGSSGWIDLGGGVFRKKGFGRVLWEDDSPLKAASSESLSDGNWYYPMGSHKLYYKPTSGNPSRHKIRTLWINVDNTPAGLDLRNKSNITVYGLTFNRNAGGILHGSHLTKTNEQIIKNLIFHNNNFNKCYWGIWSNLSVNVIESDVQIFDNNLNYCNSGISAWVGSDYTPGHNQHHKRYRITRNQINNHASMTPTKVWSDALLNTSAFLDHEAISFQNVQDSEITDNKITTSFEKDFTHQYMWTRAIIFFLPGTNVASTGNIIARNQISGHFFPSIYFASPAGFAGFEENIITHNEIRNTLPNKGQISFEVYMRSNNPTSGRNYFVNNTIINKEEGIGVFFYGKLSGNWVIRNNLIESSTAVKISADNNVGNLIFDHNIYPGLAGSHFNIEGGRTFARWKSAGYDTVGSSTVIPLFVSPTNLKPKPDSPVIDAGQSVGIEKALKDLDGLPIYGTPDIGAYEFQPIL